MYFSRRQKQFALGCSLVGPLVFGLFHFELYLEEGWARNTLFVNAAGRGDTKAVRAFLDEGTRPDARNFHSRSALQHAASSGYGETVQLLLQRGADPNSALRDAASGKHNEIAEMLIAYGAKVKGKAGALSLGSAVKSGDPATVLLLLQNGADPNACDEYETLPLQYAAQNGSWEIFQTLIERDADIRGRDRYGKTVLMSAASSDKADSVRISRYLIQHGLDVNAKDNDGRTALIYSVYFYRDNPPNTMMAQLDLLLQSGANRHIQDKDGRTALSYATEFRNAKAKARLRKA